MKIIPAKSKPNKWLDTIVQDSSIKGIPPILISKYGLHPFIKYLMEDNK